MHEEGGEDGEAVSAVEGDAVDAQSWWEAKVAELEAEREDALQQLVVVTGERDEMLGLIGEKSQEVDDLSARVEDKASLLAVRESRIAELEQQLQAAHAGGSSASSDATVTSRLEALTREHEQLQGVAKQTALELQALKGQQGKGSALDGSASAELAAKVEALMKERDAALEQLDGWKPKLAAAQMERDEMVTERDEALQQATEQSASNAELLERIEELTAALEEARAGGGGDGSPHILLSLLMP
jgi:chromosome segregation ATPase